MTLVPRHAPPRPRWTAREPRPYGTPNHWAGRGGSAAARMRARQQRPSQGGVGRGSSTRQIQTQLLSLSADVAALRSRERRARTVRPGPASQHARSAWPAETSTPGSTGAPRSRGRERRPSARGHGAAHRPFIHPREPDVSSEPEAKKGFDEDEIDGRRKGDK